MLQERLSCRLNVDSLLSKMDNDGEDFSEADARQLWLLVCTAVCACWFSSELALLGLSYGNSCPQCPCTISRSEDKGGGTCSFTLKLGLELR